MKKSQINFVKKQFVSDVKKYISEIDLLEKDIEWVIFRGVFAPYSVIKSILSNKDNKCTEDVFEQLKNNYPFNNEEFTFSVTVKGDISYRRDQSKDGKVVWMIKKMPTRTTDIQQGQERYEKGTGWNIIKVVSN